MLSSPQNERRKHLKIKTNKQKPYLYIHPKFNSNSPMTSLTDQSDIINSVIKFPLFSFVLAINYERKNVM